VPILLPLAALWADLMVHVARTELRVGAMVESRLVSLGDLVSHVPNDAHVIAVDEQFALGGLPTLYFGVGPAMRPPFRRSVSRVTWWGDLATLPRGPILEEERSSLVIARVVDHRYVVKDPVIPPLPAQLPKLVATPGDAAEFRFETSIPARAVAGVKVGSATVGEFTCTWIGSRVKRETRGALPGLGGAPQAFVSASEDFEWLADPIVLGVRIDGAAVTTIEPLSLQPKRAERLPAGSRKWPLPEVWFKPPDQPPSGAYRLTVEFAINDRDRPMMVSEEPAFILQEKPGGVRAYDVERQASSVIVPSRDTTAENIIDRLDAVLRITGSRLLPLAIRIEALDPRSRAVEARSRWRICFLELRE
jgi:hypothetical protein